MTDLKFDISNDLFQEKSIYFSHELPIVHDVLSS